MLPDYHRYNEELKCQGKTMPAPYFMCAQLCMMEAGFIMWSLNHDSPPQQQGMFRPVFDSHEEYSGRAQLMFDNFARLNPWCSRHLLPAHYESDKDYLVLQAADNLAYESRRLLLAQEYDKHIPERKAMTRLKENVYRIYKLNYDSLKAINEDQTPEAIPLTPEIAIDIRLSRYK